jgi:nucleotide-binding universal stress UspA family protein
MKILAATDGSRGGSAALDFAARLATRDGDNELIVLTVDPADGPASAAAAAEGADGAGSSRARKVLDRAVRRMIRRGQRATFQLVSAAGLDDVPETISREADRLKADIVVVGSEGRDTLSEWVVGGTALRLIYVASRPVTVVRAPRRRKAG